MTTFVLEHPYVSVASFCALLILVAIGSAWWVMAEALRIEDLKRSERQDWL